MSNRRRPPSSPEDLVPHLRERLENLVPSLLELGLCRVYSAEEADGQEAEINCPERVDRCLAVCCSYRFALTEAEVGERRVRWDPAEPHFIARGADGYCVHHDSATRRCRIWDARPLRCRRYDCRSESTIWKGPEEDEIDGEAFAHLPQEPA